MAIDGDVVERIVHEKEVSYQSQDLSDEEPERELRGVHDPDRPRIRMPDGQYIFADDLPLFHIRQMLFSPFRGLFFVSPSRRLTKAPDQDTAQRYRSTRRSRRTVDVQRPAVRLRS